MSSYIWKQILHEVEKSLDDTQSCINPPASNSQIYLLEQTLNCSLPGTFKEYLLTFNGQGLVNTYPYTPFLGVHYFLSSKDIIEIWTTMNTLFNREEPLEWIEENKIKSVIWSDKWIPFTDFESQQRLILDLNPGKNGISGQIFLYHSGMDYQKIVADSFEEFSLNILKRLQEKDYATTDHIIRFNDDYI